MRIAACIEWDPEQHGFAALEQRRLDPFTMWALMAADEALHDAGLENISQESEPARCRYGAIIGTGIGGITGILEQYDVMKERGPRRVSPHFIPRIMANAVSGQVAIRHGLLGTAFTTSSACASAGHAIGMAWRAIQWDDADVVITGGSESATTPLSIAGFASAKALSTRNEEPERASRPFDLDRDGFVLGEGCGLLVFEELERAKKRGARIYAEVKGFGSTDDAFHITAPKEDGDGPARAFAGPYVTGASRRRVDYVNAHGTITKYNDTIETRALKSSSALTRRSSPSPRPSRWSDTCSARRPASSRRHGVERPPGAVHPRASGRPIQYDLDCVPGDARAMRVQRTLQLAGFRRTQRLHLDRSARPLNPAPSPGIRTPSKASHAAAIQGSPP